MQMPCVNEVILTVVGLGWGECIEELAVDRDE